MWTHAITDTEIPVVDREIYILRYYYLNKNDLPYEHSVVVIKLKEEQKD